MLTGQASLQLSAGLSQEHAGLSKACLLMKGADELKKCWNPLHALPNRIFQGAMAAAPGLHHELAAHALLVQIDALVDHILVPPPIPA